MGLSNANPQNHTKCDFYQCGAARLGIYIPCAAPAVKDAVPSCTWNQARRSLRLARGGEVSGCTGLKGTANHRLPHVDRPEASSGRTTSQQRYRPTAARSAFEFSSLPPRRRAPKTIQIVILINAEPIVARYSLYEAGPARDRDTERSTLASAV